MLAGECCDLHDISCRWSVFKCMQRIIFQARQQFLRVIGENFDSFFFVLTPDNTFFLVNNESIGADANYFFKCHDDVCTDVCLFGCKCIVDAAVCSHSTTILLILCASFSRQTIL